MFICQQCHFNFRVSIKILLLSLYIYKNTKMLFSSLATTLLFNTFNKRDNFTQLPIEPCIPLYKVADQYSVENTHVSQNTLLHLIALLI